MFAEHLWQELHIPSMPHYCVKHTQNGLKKCKDFGNIPLVFLFVCWNGKKKHLEE